MKLSGTIGSAVRQGKNQARYKLHRTTESCNKTDRPIFKILIQLDQNALTQRHTLDEV